MNGFREKPLRTDERTNGRGLNSRFFRILRRTNNGLDISCLRKLEKLSVKRRKAELDLTFLKNCKLILIIPKFLCFQIPYGSTNKLHAIRKRLLWNAISERFETHSAEVKSKISSLDWYVLNRCIKTKRMCYRVASGSPNNTRRNCETLLRMKSFRLHTRTQSRTCHRKLLLLLNFIFSRTNLCMT